MAQQKGSVVQSLLGVESTFGTAPADGFVMPINTSNLAYTRALNVAQTLTGTRNPVEPFSGNKEVTGSIVVPADSEAFWYWLQCMFGDPVTTGSGPYVHEFKIGSSMPSFTFENAYTDLSTNKYERWVGCRVSSVSMSFGGDGELVATLNVIGKESTVESSAFDASPTTVSLARVENFELAAEEGGSEISNATEISFDLDFDLDSDDRVIGGGGAHGSLTSGIVKPTGNLKTLFEDDSLITKALNATETSLKVTATASASSVLEFEFQEMKYAPNSPALDGPKGMKVDLNFFPFYDDGAEGSAVVARVTNNTEHA